MKVEMNNMLLTTKNSDRPQRLYDAHNTFQSVTMYFKDPFIGLVQELEDHKGLLMVTVHKNLYDELSQHEKDIFKERIENIWKLYQLEDVEIVDTEGGRVYQSWYKSPRAH
jgi:hypothetical protein